jgi:hypothetical protein
MRTYKVSTSIARTNKSTHPAGYIYLCQLRIDRGTNIYKIGYTNNVKARMLSLKAYESLYERSIDDAYQKEQYLHKLCRIVFGNNARDKEYYYINDKHIAIDLIDMVAGNEEIP